MTTQWWAILLIIINTLIGSFGPIYLKKGANKLKFNIKNIIQIINLCLVFYAMESL